MDGSDPYGDSLSSPRSQEGGRIEDTAEGLGIHDLPLLCHCANFRKREHHDFHELVVVPARRPLRQIRREEEVNTLVGETRRGENGGQLADASRHVARLLLKLAPRADFPVFARFVGPTGGITKPDTLTQAFTRLMSRSPLPRITLHGLRHSHATQMARLSTNKVEFKAVSRRLGHATEAFTLATYVDVELDDQAGPLGRLAAQMAK